MRKNDINLHFNPADVFIRSDIRHAASIGGKTISGEVIKKSRAYTRGIFGAIQENPPLADKISLGWR
jgi:hypothetical protein